jgi:hypothetical protein
VHPSASSASKNPSLNETFILFETFNQIILKFDLSLIPWMHWMHLDALFPEIYLKKKSVVMLNAIQFIRVREQESQALEQASQVDLS